jgi:AbrB family looped-hinge helix DNA binding protein
VTTFISSKGQIVLPAKIRKQDGIVVGQEFKIERLKAGEYLIRKKPRRNEGLVDWLLKCPVKGFFVPFDRSETTDDL